MTLEDTLSIIRTDKNYKHKFSIGIKGDKGRFYSLKFYNDEDFDNFVRDYGDADLDEMSIEYGPEFDHGDYMVFTLALSISY